MFGQQSRGPARELVTEIARVLLHRLDQRRLKLAVGLGRPTRALVRPQTRQTFVLEPMQPTGNDRPVEIDDASDLRNLQLLRRKVHRLGSPIDPHIGRLLAQLRNHLSLAFRQTADKKRMGHDRGPP